MSEFIEFLLDGLLPLGRVQAKRMFGGYGIFIQDVMFAIVVEDTLYLKADEQNAPEFDRLELPHFQYHRKNKAVRMSYRLAPDTIFDDPDELLSWGRLGIQAALRQQQQSVR